MMAHYTLTIYESDDTTPLLEVGTAASHPHPYLHVPGEMDLGEVDLLRGRAAIGQVNLRVIDPQTGPTQAERWMTARLGIPEGEVGAGHSALNGRRAVLRRSDGRLVIDGVAWGVQLSDSAAGFTLQVRDVRERARKLPLFTRTGTASVLPRGVIDGYGRLPGGGWLVPPTRPLTATVVTAGVAGIFLNFVPHHWRWNRRVSRRRTIPELVVTDAIREAVQVSYPVGGAPRATDVSLLWRYVGDSEWQEIRAPVLGGQARVGLLSVDQARIPATELYDEQTVEAVRGIGLSLVAQPSPLPTVGSTVEVILRYDGPPTEAYPYHYEGPAGELIRGVLRGDYSASSAPSKIRYDESAVLALTTPVRLRLTRPVDDARPWLEQAYQQLAAAPALDSQGRISPVTAELPPVTAELPVITEQNASAIPGWEHPADGAVTSVSVKYQRDYLVRAIDDPFGERSAGDGIASIDVTVEHAAPGWAVDLMGDHPLEVDGWLYRAIGGSDGDPVTGDVINEDGAQASRRLARRIIDRWLFGGQVSFVRVRETDFEGLREGSWVIDERPWRPNYREGLRGGSTLAQVVSVRAAVPGYLDLRLVDAGPLDQPLNVPSIGPLAATDSGEVRIPVTTVPTGAEVAVYYAISNAQPGADSPLWTYAGSASEIGDVETPPAPSGARVYVRARSEAPGRRPSGWTPVRQITLPATPRLTGVRLEVDGEGTAVVVWSPGRATQGVRIYYATYPLDDEPPSTLTTHIDREASELEADLPVVVEDLEGLLIEIEPWTGWTGTGVSGTAGERVAAAVERDDRRGPPGPPGAAAEVRYSGPQPGQNVSSTFDPQVHRYAQFRVGQGNWSDWARIVGEEGEDGDYIDYIFRAASSQPSTPSGESPANWHDAPPTVPDGQYLWMSRARRHADGTLAGSWSAPVRLTGPQGPPGVPPEEAQRPTLTLLVNTYQEQQYLYHLTAQDHTGSTSGMQYRERRWLAGQSVPPWGGWQTIGDQPRQIPVAVHASSERFIEVQVRDSEGRESLIHRSSVPPLEESTGGWVRGEVDEGVDAAITGAVGEMHDRGLTDTGFTGALRSGSTSIPTSTAIDGVDRARTGLDNQGRLQTRVVDQRQLLAVTAANRGSIQREQSVPILSAKWIAADQAYELTISTHTVRYGFGEVTYNGATYLVSNYNVTIYVYADDPDLQGGSFVYGRVLNPADVIRDGRYYVGKIALGGPGGGPSTGGGGAGGGDGFY